ncbi:MAG: glycoside hydrolase family 95 protein [Bacteroides sp.]|nr:glycoside hydrolase family 95 protein [Bacteroides sp.]MCM1390139.1 glycoside hydrolase family 95 protein [Bacteroides sp.]
MKHITTLSSISCLGIAMSLSAAGTMSPDYNLWYEAPASLWEETLPTGNGRMGMMPYGNPTHEKIVLNEISMWSGAKANYDNPEAATSLPEIRRLLVEGKNDSAQQLMYKTFVPDIPTSGKTYGAYQTLADLNIDFKYQSPSSEPTDYIRYLDLRDATAYTEYKIGDITYRQECSVPRGKEVMLYHISASSPGAISFTASLSRPERATVAGAGKDRIMISGTLESGIDGHDGVKYAAVAGITASGSDATTSSTDSTLTVTGADEAWIVIGAATSYLYGATYMTKAEYDVNSAISSGRIAQIQKEGQENHKALFDRATVKFEESDISRLPTNRRIEEFRYKDDPSLAALYYNYGRYLLICSTLPGALPPNLQGLWANEVWTPWNGDYHTNINVQMNHWQVEPGNLHELHRPLIDLVKRSVESGEHTAKVFYGDDAQGWVMHMMTNPWQFTEPGEHPSWGATNTGGAWLCAHLWEHYLYSLDKQYLSEIYPILKGASQFFHSTMIKEPRHGYLVTAPSSSPENTFFFGKDSVETSVCMGPAMDSQIIRELFSNTIEAATTLGVDRELADSLSEDLKLLPPIQIGSDGRIMEWLEEYEEIDPQHRHVSHLYALHPGNEISPTMTPQLAEAARKTLDTRGDAGTGWSRAWKINFWARLGDGNRAYSLFKSLLTPAYTAEKPHHGPGTFPNLFCSHPPFQMDGNWGGAAGIGEMLVQSHEGFINLLPALPDALNTGELKGFKARDGITIEEMTWRDGRVEKVILIGGPSRQIRLLTPSGAKSAVLNGNEFKPSKFIEFTLNEGERAEILFK